jgi:hypothetical protein
MVSRSCSTRLFVAGIIVSVSAALQFSFGGDITATDEAPNRAKNLARMNCRAQITCITPDGHFSSVGIVSELNNSAAALMMDDDTLSFPLQRGETIFVIKLPRTSTLERFAFINENAAACGEVKIEVSNYRLAATNSKWATVNRSIPFTGKRFFQLSMVGIEARYVKLSFRVEKEGRVAGLGLYGEQTLQAFAGRQNKLVQMENTFGLISASRRPEDSLNFNFANSYALARVAYTSSGETALEPAMIDDHAATEFQFSAVDPHPTAIVELAEVQQLQRISAVYAMQAGRLDVYLLNELPKKLGDLGGLLPVTSVMDTLGGGKAAVEFDRRGVRYIALQWTPAKASGGGEPFALAEIGAFGDVPLALAALDLVPSERFVNNLTVQPVPEPPVIVPVSP